MDNSMYIFLGNGEVSVSVQRTGYDGTDSLVFEPLPESLPVGTTLYDGEWIPYAAKGQEVRVAFENIEALAVVEKCLSRIRKNMEGKRDATPKTLDVGRARRWLIDNHPTEECRHLAELLHDYSLYVTESK